MNTSKFRAWDKNHKCYEYINDLYWFEENFVHDFDDDRFLFEQFTGLTDKNGKDIYYNSSICRFKLKKQRLNLHDKDEFIELEGVFLLNDEYLRCEIELLPKYEKDGYIVLWYDPETMSEIEVIGNIHENKELLK